MKKNKLKQLILLLLFIIMLVTDGYFNEEENKTINKIDNHIVSYSISNIPKNNGEIYIEINNNIPEFTEEDLNIEKDYYSKLENGRVRNSNDKN